MSKYVRLINRERWEDVSSVDELCGEAITVDWSCKENDWSVFKCGDNPQKNDDEVNKITLKMVGSMTDKTAEGADLLVLKDNFLADIGEQPEEDKPVLECTHCNIHNINYAKIKKAIAYTLDSPQIISYSIRDIKELFLNASPEYIDEYENIFTIDRIKRVRNAFLKDVPKGKIFRKYNL